MLTSADLPDKAEEAIAVQRRAVSRQPRAVRMAPEQRLSQIVDAATTLIAERGFWGLTLRDVAFACGLTEAGLLHHVTSKDKLLIAVLQRRDDDDVATVSRMLGTSVDELRELDPLPISLRDLAAALVAHNAARPEIVQLYSVLDAEALDEAHPAHDFFEARERRALNLFERAARPRADATTIACATLSAMDGLQLQWLRSRGSMDLIQRWAEIAEILLPQRRQ